jgi:hypothetical protein
MLFEQSLNLIKDNFYFGWFTLLLFVAGFMISAIVEKVPELAMLKVFPHWLVRFTMRYASPKRPFWQIFSFIAMFNTLAIFFYMMSGIFVIVPFVIALLTGLNIGIIMQEPVPEEFRKLNPFDQEAANFSFYSIFGAVLVPLFELIIFCAFVGIGMSMGVGIALSYSPFMIAVLVKQRALSYFIIGMPTLLVAALLEAAAIKDLHDTK